MSFAMKTDMYELTMAEAWLRDGRINDPAVFEVFSRKLTPRYRYGVVGGISRIVDAVKNFRFDLSEVAWLVEQGVVSSEMGQWLRKYEFRGTLRAYREGDVYFPGSPVVQVEGTLGDCILETLILSIINFDSAVMTKAARIVAESHGAPVIEMGSRRTHDDAAVDAARAAYIAGFAATSNLAAGYLYGVPVKGTAAHAFTLSSTADQGGVHAPQIAELHAFESQVRTHGPGTTLLVDTYNIEYGIRNAVQAAGGSLGAIRIDSGDLALESAKARRLLDELGAYGTRIIVTSDLDEDVIKDLRVAGAPIDGYGVGTKLVSVPPPGFVYKLVEVNGVAVAKKAKDKISVGGKKFAWRTLKDGKIVDEFTVLKPDILRPEHEILLFPMVQFGELTGRGQDSQSIEYARDFHRAVMNQLPLNERAVWYGDHGPYLTCEVRREE